MEKRYQGLGFRTDQLPDQNQGAYAERYPYIADKGLVDAVNMALFLKRPLLVKGPPGCGKSKLAGAIAFELGIKPENTFFWPIKSVSLARDGLYTIDMVRRLQDAQTLKKAVRLVNYIRLGPLGEAIERGTRGIETVILIDEIDKADIDFPNDLLYELEQKGFVIEELNQADILPDDPIKRSYQNPNPQPIIIITSNDEKELPDAFLRRCLFYYIRFPGFDLLKEIVKVNLESLGYDLNETLVELAINRLIEIRQAGEFRKKPATSELIDWLLVLHHWGVEISQALLATNDLIDLPYLETLLKHQQDYALLNPNFIDG